MDGSRARRDPRRQRSGHYLARLPIAIGPAPVAEFGGGAEMEMLVSV